jgi:prohibitin 2
MPPKTIASLISGAVIIFVLIIGATSATYVVDPGYRGVEVTLGKVSPVFKPQGFGFKLPFATRIVPLLIRQQTARMEVDCYSSDLHQVKMDLRILYRVPDASVVSLFRDYAGEPFDTLIKPRVAESINEVTALQSAEAIVQKREEVKTRVLVSARKKLGDLVVLEDVVLEDIVLTQILENAIEAKMVQEQEAARARFSQQQAQTEASTAVIKARGEAESINLRGKALRENPTIIDLQIVERWDGITPLVVGPSADGASMILPLGNSKSHLQPATRK